MEDTAVPTPETPKIPETPLLDRMLLTRIEVNTQTSNDKLDRILPVADALLRPEPEQAARGLELNALLSELTTTVNGMREELDAQTALMRTIATTQATITQRINALETEVPSALREVTTRMHRMHTAMQEERARSQIIERQLTALTRALSLPLDPGATG